jgi:EAL domain-containing protein (putative c-di-GMP-specific phosphodiesterase class I)
LRSVIAMARSLEMVVVAEGVETDDDAADLVKMGCHYGQSYLFGPPMDAASVQRLLKERFPLTKRA